MQRPHRSRELHEIQNRLAETEAGRKNAVFGSQQIEPDDLSQRRLNIHENNTRKA